MILISGATPLSTVFTVKITLVNSWIVVVTDLGTEFKSLLWADRYVSNFKQQISSVSCLNFDCGKLDLLFYFLFSPRTSEMME